MRLGGYLHLQERLKGYIRVHEDYALDIDKDLILYGDYDVKSGHRLLIHLTQMENPQLLYSLLTMI